MLEGVEWSSSPAVPGMGDRVDAVGRGTLMLGILGVLFAAHADSSFDAGKSDAADAGPASPATNPVGWGYEPAVSLYSNEAREPGRAPSSEVGRHNAVVGSGPGGGSDGSHPDTLLGPPARGTGDDAPSLERGCAATSEGRGRTVGEAIATVRQAGQSRGDRDSALTIGSGFAVHEPCDRGDVVAEFGHVHPGWRVTASRQAGGATEGNAGAGAPVAAPTTMIAAVSAGVGSLQRTADPLDNMGAILVAAVPAGIVTLPVGLGIVWLRSRR